MAKVQIPIYSQYLDIIDYMKNNPNKSLKAGMKDRIYTAERIVQFKKMGLIKVDLINMQKGIVKNHVLKDNLTEQQFNEIYCDTFNQKKIYVFDKENNLIDLDFNMLKIGKKYGVHEKVVKHQLIGVKTLEQNYFFSYNKDHKVVIYSEIDYLHGKQTKYTPEYIEKILPNGEWSHLSYPSLAKKCGVNEATILKWVNRYPEFKEAYYNRDYYKFKEQKKTNQVIKSLIKRPTKKISKIDAKLNELKKESKVQKVDNIGKYEDDYRTRQKDLLVLELAKKQEKELNKPVRRLGKIGSLDALKQRINAM